MVLVMRIVVVIIVLIFLLDIRLVKHCEKQRKNWDIFHPKGLHPAFKNGFT